MVASRQDGPVRAVVVPPSESSAHQGPDRQPAIDGASIDLSLGGSDSASQNKLLKLQCGDGDLSAEVVVAVDDAADDEPGCTSVAAVFRDRVVERVSKYKPVISKITKASVFVAYNMFLIYAIYRAVESGQELDFCSDVGFLIVITALVYLACFYYLVLKPAWNLLMKSGPGHRMLEKGWRPFAKLCNCLWANRWVRLATSLVVYAAILTYLIVDTVDERSRMVSAFGIVAFVFLSWIFSHNMAKVVWRHVLWGLALQLLFGIIILRWDFGRQVFKCLGDKVTGFLKYTDEGSKFVFGFLIDDFVFAFNVLSVIIFFSFSIQILYYYGIMQVVIMKLGWLLEVTVGTTACESISAAANIFVGQTEAPLLVKPFIARLTRSEIHAIMTGGFASIAGSVFAAYVSFGVSPSHLLSASLMSAPAALAISKLVYPETERSRTTADDINIEKGEEVNALDAASRGAMAVVKICGYIAASLIAFIAFIAFVNGVLGWLGELVGFTAVFGKPLSFQYIASFVFRPAAWLMGVPWSESGYVGELIALKTVLNEFVAYGELRKMVAANLLSARSSTIATYALCGFSNLGAIGIQISGLSAMAPERKSDFARLAFSAMVAGNIACFLTACVAGTLISDPSSVPAGIVEAVTNAAALA